MFALSLVPLGCYFCILALFFLRSCPRVLSGPGDFTLLAFGVFGLVTLGPARLIIPMPVFSFWGLGSWFFWTIFYVAVVQGIASRMPRRIVIYNCSLEHSLRLLNEMGQSLDPGFRVQGNVLTLPGYGLQCVFRADRCGGHFSMEAISKEPQENWLLFEKKVRDVWELHPSVGRNRMMFFVLIALSLSIFSFALVTVCFQYERFIALFYEYWL